MPEEQSDFHFEEDLSEAELEDPTYNPLPEPVFDEFVDFDAEELEFVLAWLEEKGKAND